MLVELKNGELVQWKDVPSWDDLPLYITQGLTLEQANGLNRLRDFEDCKCPNHGKRGCDWTTKNCIAGTRKGIVCTLCLRDCSGAV